MSTFTPSEVMSGNKIVVLHDVVSVRDGAKSQCHHHQLVAVVADSSLPLHRRHLLPRFTLDLGFHA